MSKKYYETHRELCLLKSRKYRLEHLDECREYDKTRRLIIRKENKKRYDKYRRYFEKTHPTYHRDFARLDRRKNPEKYRRIHYKCYYKITLEQYNEILKKQNGVCAICGKFFVNKIGEMRNLFVDHNHKTKKIRGLLCHNCNTTLGRIEKDPEILKNMIEYLKKD